MTKKKLKASLFAKDEKFDDLENKDESWELMKVLINMTPIKKMFSLKKLKNQVLQSIFFQKMQIKYKTDYVL